MAGQFALGGSFVFVWSILLGIAAGRVPDLKPVEADRGSANSNNSIESWFDRALAFVRMEENEMKVAASIRSMEGETRTHTCDLND